MNSCVAENVRTGMADAVLQEALEALEAYASTATPYVIDLKSLPMSAGDLEELEQTLGRGEVQIELDVAGKSEIWETMFPGLWWVRHRGADLQIVTETLEITRIPEVVCTHPEDIHGSHQRLREVLGTRGVALEEPFNDA